jgi:hypothetical protein
MLAAFDLDRLPSFCAKHGLDDTGEPNEEPKRTRTERRVGTRAVVIEQTTHPPDSGSRLRRRKAPHAGALLRACTQTTSGAGTATTRNDCIEAAERP